MLIRSLLEEIGTMEQKGGACFERLSRPDLPDVVRLLQQSVDTSAVLCSGQVAIVSPVVGLVDVTLIVSFASP